MANRPKGFGLTAESTVKKDATFDLELALQAIDWVQKVASLDLTPSGGTFESASDVQEVLKDGTALCVLINQLQPGSVKKYNQSKMAFKQMENISKFLDACEAFGVCKMDTFQTVDLYEGANIPKVITGLHALGRVAQNKGYDGPILGPAPAKESRREFTEEDLRAGSSIIGLSAGPTGMGATSFGFGRPTMDSS